MNIIVSAIKHLFKILILHWNRLLSIKLISLHAFGLQAFRPTAHILLHFTIYVSPWLTISQYRLAFPFLRVLLWVLTSWRCTAFNWAYRSKFDGTRLKSPVCTLSCPLTRALYYPIDNQSTTAHMDRFTKSIYYPTFNTFLALCGPNSHFIIVGQWLSGFKHLRLRRIPIGGLELDIRFERMTFSLQVNGSAIWANPAFRGKWQTRTV